MREEEWKVNYLRKKKMEISNIDMHVSTNAIRSRVLDKDGWIKVLPAESWNEFSWDEVRMFMHDYPIYVLPTKELIEKLRELIQDFKTIEIGAGSGNIGRNLGIRMTDSYLQERKDIKLYYEACGQPVIKYHKDVWKADAMTAVRILKPECVLGCYVTHYSQSGPGNSWGVEFEKLLAKIRRLILVGNDHIHSDNPIMNIPHNTLRIPGMITRNEDRQADAIYVWNHVV